MNGIQISVAVASNVLLDDVKAKMAETAAYGLSNGFDVTFYSYPSFEDPGHGDFRSIDVVFKRDADGDSMQFQIAIQNIWAANGDGPDSPTEQQIYEGPTNDKEAFGDSYTALMPITLMTGHGSHGT